jgi:dihydroflavonol-4-reductase
VRAFVTGATGFIGRRLVNQLLMNDVEVVALVRREDHRLPAGVQIAHGDVLQPDSFGDAGKGCDRVFHLAAKITFDPRQRAELIRCNGEGTAHVLSAAQRWSVARVVVMSSAITLGLSYSDGAILDEDASPAAAMLQRNPYMAGKLAAEASAAAAAKHQHVVIVNPTTVYGPGDRGLNSGALIARVYRSLVLPVPPGGGNVVDVDDVVAGILAAAERGATGRRYVLGGENLRFSQIFSTVAEVVGRRPLFVPVGRWMRRPTAGAAWLAGRLTGSRFLTPQVVGDMFAFKFYTSDRARRELGYAPQYSFRQSVARAWEFYQREGLI